MPTLVDGCEEVVETGGESPEEDKQDKETQNEETASGNKSNIQNIVPKKCIIAKIKFHLIIKEKGDILVGFCLRFP